jgi:AcrR family transcriptional regulator
MANPSTVEPDGADIRSRILDAAARLVAAGGVAALTTRAVAAEASVQAPTLYRLFGDKRGLLDAVAEHGLAAFVVQKSGAAPHPDPVQDLRDAWDAYVAFGLGNPAVFAIINEVGRVGPPSPAAAAGLAVLRERVRRIARAGRLRMPEDRAVALIHATGSGTVATLLATPDAGRDPELARTARETVLAAVAGPGVEGKNRDTGRQDHAAFATGLHAHLDAVEGLSAGEALLLRELLERIAGKNA